MLRKRSMRLGTIGLSLMLLLGATMASAQSCPDWRGTNDTALQRWNARQLHEQAALLTEAVEQDARVNWGMYPSNTAGFMLFDSSFLLRNAFTYARTEPVDGAAASSGQIGYVPVAMNGINTGAVLTAFGRVSNEWIFLAGSALATYDATRPTEYLEDRNPAEPD